MNYYSEADLIESMKFSRYTLWQLRRDGLPFLRIRGRIRYELAQVEAWIQKNCQGNEQVRP